MSEEELEKIQFSRLRETCIYAYEHTAYYKRTFREAQFNPYAMKSFEEFSAKCPILTKQMVLDNMEDIQDQSITDWYPATTGGSSGTRLQVNNTWDTFYRENAFIFHHNARLGYDFKHDTMLLLCGEESTELCSTNPLYGQVRVSSKYLTSDNIADAVKFINKHKPTFITGMPSSVYMFCRYLRDSGLQLQTTFKGCTFRSENIHPEQRKYIEETLGCKTIAYYGSTERINMGEEIVGESVVPHYKFNRLYGYMELDPADGETIIGTGFINRRMPLIRYRTDDTARMVRPGVYEVSGHRTAALVGKNGEAISVAYFAHLEATFDKLAKYQLEQYERGRVVMNVVPKHELTTQEKEEIIKLFKAKCADKLDFELHVVKNVKLTPRGKFKLLAHALDEAYGGTLEESNINNNTH